ncbi:hypothetical protein THRCLA_22914 [Thraustotheca clavata]|uniref:Secreted protein n=1 Tax=Thraustotheca clavata TaxID=74557 RepID=A0A1V9YNZ4_9STRA|nr:hypothetical protein THRCLA_22914 [Thraustotheca clavata]
MRLVAALLLSTLALCQAQTADTIGSVVPYHLTIDGGAQFSQVISDPSATYLSVHIASMKLPTGAALTIGTLDDTDKMVLKGSQKDIISEYFAQPQIVIKYTAPEYHNGTVVTIDKYFAGLPKQSNLESLCSTTDQSQPAVCYASTEPVKYNTAQAIARLFIGGTTLCTGWLIGSEGHLITNNHCISSAADAAATQVEMHAECATCTDSNNGVQLGCKGPIVASSTTLVATNINLDFTLVKLNLNAGISLSQYGYLKVRDGPPVANEKVWLTHHPLGDPKRIGIYIQNNVPGTIQSPNVGTTCYANEASYLLDTQAGSSGAPVMSVVDNSVVLLHDCGGCNSQGTGYNSGIPLVNILTYLRTSHIAIPQNSIYSTTTPTPAPTPTPTPAPKPTPTPTRAPKPTPTPTPTRAPKPTPAPTPTPTPTATPKSKPKPRS